MKMIARKKKRKKKSLLLIHALAELSEVVFKGTMQSWFFYDTKLIKLKCAWGAVILNVRCAAFAYVKLWTTTGQTIKQM